MKKYSERKIKVSKSNNEIIGPWKMVWLRFKKNKLAVIGGILFFVLVFLVVFAPLIAPYGRDDIDLTKSKLAPSAQHLLGTDNIGRDQFTRLLYGGRISLMVGILAVSVSVIIGIIIGGISGFYGGWIDSILMRFAEIIYSFPFLPLVITLSALLFGKVSSQNKMYIVMVLIGILSWPGLARLIRGQILSLREQEFMLAANAIGISDIAKIFRHLIQNTLGYIMVYIPLSMAAAILTESGLSFLGLGVTDPVPTWGNMIQVARDGYIMRTQPWLWIPPGVCILWAVMTVNLLGEGLRDAFDPKALK